MLKKLLSSSGFTRELFTLAYSPRYVFGIGEKKLKELRAHVESEKSGLNKRTMSYNDIALMIRVATRVVTGDAMMSAIKSNLSELDFRSGTLMVNILKKDLRGGFSVGSINEAYPGLIEVTPYMRCALPTKARPENWDWRKHHIAQLKADGMFANIIRRGAGATPVEICTRQGQYLPKMPFEALMKDAAAIFQENTVTMGELIVRDASGDMLPREIGNGILNSMCNGEDLPDNHLLEFYAWDQIPYDKWVEKGVYDVPYMERFTKLGSQIFGPSFVVRSASISQIWTFEVESYAEAKARFAERLKAGDEGIVLKHAEGAWKDGTSSHQVKFKLEFHVELKVVGFEEGNGKHAATFGSLICESECGQLRVGVGGLTDALRKEVHENREDWLGAIITVKANGIMLGEDSISPNAPEASLYLPAFIERRMDRTTADDLDRIIQIRDSVIEAM